MNSQSPNQKQQLETPYQLFEDIGSSSNIQLNMQHPPQFVQQEFEPNLLRTQSQTQPIQAYPQIPNGQSSNQSEVPLPITSPHPFVHQLYQPIQGQRNSVKSKCPYCGRLASTRISFESGNGFWFICFFMPCGVSLVTCCGDDYSDVIHHCRGCGRQLGKTAYQPCEN